MLEKVLKKIKNIFIFPSQKFDATGERVDIMYNDQIDFEKLDIYQKSHFRRYEFALSIVDSDETCGDFACGTGYGSVMLSKKASNIIGADLNYEVIRAINKRYRKNKKIKFLHENLLNLKFNLFFDTIVSFETIEHFSEENIRILLSIFYKSLKINGKLIFSTPYMQERSEAAIKMGHHLTFYIDEEKIKNWMITAGFDIEICKYQNYISHTLYDNLEKKDFIICIARKKM
jgi:2-polyprenyl-3-methyl-5-hydroxy-6-metoxy-1,4-benzoquinol methylase